MPFKLWNEYGHCIIYVDKFTRSFFYLSKVLIMIIEMGPNNRYRKIIMKNQIFVLQKSHLRRCWLWKNWSLLSVNWFHCWKSDPKSWTYKFLWGTNLRSTCQKISGQVQIDSASRLERYIYLLWICWGNSWIFRGKDNQPVIKWQGWVSSTPVQIPFT